LKQGGNYEKITLLAEDGTKFFLNSSLLNKAKLSGIEFKVLNKINLLFVNGRKLRKIKEYILIKIQE